MARLPGGYGGGGGGDDDGGGSDSGVGSRPTGIAGPSDTPGDSGGGGGGSDRSDSRGGSGGGAGVVSGGGGTSPTGGSSSTPSGSGGVDRGGGPADTSRGSDLARERARRTLTPEQRQQQQRARERVDEFIADDPEDFGDTPIRFPEETPAVGGRRFESVLRGVGARNRAFAEGVGEGFGDVVEGAAVAGGTAPDRAGGDVVEPFVTGMASAPGDIVVGAGTLLKEVPETAGALVTGDATPGDVGSQGARLAEQTALDAKNNPGRFAGGLVAETALGLGAGAAVGRGSRFAVDRVRTRGATRVGPEDLTGEDVVRFQDTGGAEGQRFPPFRDEQLAKSDPAEAVREQAADRTPDEIAEQFDAAGVERGEQGADLKKALDVEPESSSGFKTQTGEFESPGSFFGPELSPNFLRLGERGGVSLRPGLPDLGGRPTGVVARTDVRNPDADSLAGLNRELREAEGDTTARAKPTEAVNVGEAEAIVPPGARFEGVGSERFFTEVGGRRVPIRTVAPEGRRGSSVDVDADTVDAGTGRRGGGSRPSGTLDDLSEPVRQPVDRPLPTPSASGAGAGGRSRVSDTQPPGSDRGEPGSRPDGTRSSPGTRRPPGSGGGSGGGGEGTPESSGPLPPASPPSAPGSSAGSVPGEPGASGVGTSGTGQPPAAFARGGGSSGDRPRLPERDDEEESDADRRLAGFMKVWDNPVAGATDLFGGGDR